MARGDISIEFEGLDDLRKRLQRQPNKVKAEAKRVVDNTALRVEKKAVILAPHDTGYLEQHIVSSSDGPLSAKVVAEAEYSVYQEFGTRKMPAYPFMTPAMKQESPFLYQKLNNLVNRGLL